MTDYGDFKLEEIGSLDLDELQQPWQPAPNIDKMDVPALSGNRSYSRPASAYQANKANKTYTDTRTTPEALKHLTRLPDADETHHLIMGGTYGLWQLVPATLERLGPGATIPELYVATLSFSKQNAADMLEMIDAGQIGKVTLIVSHYFKHTNPEIYGALIPQLQAKGHRTIAMRSHCKILLMKASDGRKFAIEASANLRSSKNIEQATFTQHAGLYDFHATWMGELFETRGKP